MRKISADKLYELAPGTSIMCGNTIGVFLGKELTTGEYELWDGSSKLDMGQLLEDSEEETIGILSDEINIDLLIKVATADIMILASDGWTLEKPSKYFDITMYIDRLKVLVVTKSALDNVENK